MGIVQLPTARDNRGRGRGDLERPALRHGLANVSLVRMLLVLDHDGADAAAYCAGCAGPIEFGPVVRGAEKYCSIECSLGGDRPA